VYCAVMRHDGHLGARGRGGGLEPQASVFFISRVFSHVRSVLPQCGAQFGLLHLLYDRDFTNLE